MICVKNFFAVVRVPRDRNAISRLLLKMRGKQMTEGTHQLRGLVIADPWFSLILSGTKTWEMRSRATHFRGALAIIRKGSGVVTGVVDIVDCITGQAEAEYGASEAFHCVPRDRHKEYAKKWPFAWVITNARPLSEPVPYKHKKGAQSWVVLSRDESAAVTGRDSSASLRTGTERAVSRPRAGGWL